jgi:hypothetical protein
VERKIEITGLGKVEIRESERNLDRESDWLFSEKPEKRHDPDPQLLRDEVIPANPEENLENSMQYETSETNDIDTNDATASEGSDAYGSDAYGSGDYGSDGADAGDGGDGGD